MQPSIVCNLPIQINNSYTPVSSCSGALGTNKDRMCCHLSWSGKYSMLG